jgi:small subunit ribosomal protein S6
VSPLSTVSIQRLSCIGRKAVRTSRRGLAADRRAIEESRKGKPIMALYEHVFLARQDVSSQQADALVEQYKGVLEANGGKVGRVENWGLKSLTYRMNKNRKAHYVLMDIDAPAAAVKEMERQMRINEDILRYLTIRVEAHEEGPSAMMQKRDRDDRPRRGDRDDRGPRRPREDRS